jgi:hypothetical protein
VDSGTGNLRANRAGGLTEGYTDLRASLVSQDLQQQRSALIVGQPRKRRLDGIELLLCEYLTLNGIRGTVSPVLLLAQELLTGGYS